MVIGWFDLLVLLGAANSMVFMGVILAQRPQTPSSGLLAAILTILGVLCAKILLHTLGLWQHPTFRYFPLGVDVSLPPLLWLYVISLTEPQRLRLAFYAKHLTLPLVFLGYALVVYAKTISTESLEAKAVIADQLWYGPIKAIEDILSIVLGIIYGFWSFKQLHKYQVWVDTYLSNPAVPTYNWLRNLFVITAVMLVLLGLMLASQQFGNTSFVPIQVFYFYIVFLIYVFGFFGFRHSDFRTSLELLTKKTVAFSNLQQSNLLERLEQWMDSDKPYLQPDLNLSQCADKLRCAPQALSEAINLGKNKNFREYINLLRIEEFKKRMATANLQKETIIGIAYDCGFNSEASFYRIFKEKTGKAPKDFLSK